jgi:hypothetical protein
MVAASVLAVAAFCLLSLLPMAVLGARRSEHRLRAGALAQNWLDRQKVADFNTYALGSTSSLPPEVLPDGVQLSPSLRVQSVTGTSNARVFRVTVRWKERGLDLEVFRQLTLAPLSR